MSRFSVVLLLTAAPLAAAPVPKVKAKPPSLQGTWEVVERQNDAKPYLRGIIREFWTIDAGSIAMRFGADETALKDPDPTVLWLDLPDADDTTAVSVIQRFPCGQTSNMNARVEFDGETVRLAMGSSDGGPRPALAKPAIGVSYLVLKRVDEAKQKAK